MAQSERWQLGGQGPEAYEQYLVPVLFVPWATVLVGQAALQPDDRVLDAACGTGIVARRVAPHVGRTGSVIGLDLNSRMLAVAQTLPPGSRVSIAWQEGNLEALPFDDQAFNVVLCQQALQCCSNRAAAVCELHRVLQPGGRLLLNVSRDLPHVPYLNVLVQAVPQHVHAEAGQRMRAPCTLGNLEELRARMRTEGFREVHIQIHILPMRIAALEHFLPVQFAASPIANNIAALDDTARGALLTQLTAAIPPYRDDQGYMLPYETHLVRAQA